jgi:K+-sensing histidine kinase KdpD
MGADVSVSSRIERVRSEDLLEEPSPPRRGASAGISVQRRLAGLAIACLALPLLTMLLHGPADRISGEGQVLLYLLVVAVVAAVGGFAVAVFAAVAAALLINYFFLEPVHTLDVAHADQAVALFVFVGVAAIVSGLVELAGRRGRLAEQAGAQAKTLSELASADLDQPETLRAVLERARMTFSMESVTLKVRDRVSGEWVDVEAAGWGPRGEEAPLRFDLPVDVDVRLVGRGPELFAQDQRVLLAFAGAAHTAWSGRQLSEQAREAHGLENVDRQRTALLAAVGHDLRTPLAGIKASVSTLRQTDVAWSDAEREELLAAIEGAADRLEAVVGNLLDASRLQAGVVSAQPEPVAVDEVVGAALQALPDALGQVNIDIPDDLPPVNADPGLLERVLVNLLDNALRHGAGQPVELTAFALAESVKLEIVDHGPGVSAEERKVLFEPFRRLDESNTQGVGLGLTVARGFTEAMGGVVIADRTDGGGLTMRLRLPRAAPAAAPVAPVSP